MKKNISFKRTVLIIILINLIAFSLLYIVKVSGYDYESVIDDFNDETKIYKYNNIYVNTTDGYVRLLYNEQPYNTTGLLLWLHMNEGTGINVEDFSGYDNNGTIQNGEGDEWLSGKFYYGIDLDGDNDRISCGNDLSLSPSNSLSVEFWFKRNEINIETQGMFSKEDHLVVEFFSNKIYIKMNPEVWFLSTGTITDYDWHHLVWTYTKVTNNTYLYLDGKLNKTQKIDQWQFNNFGQVWIGTRGTSEFNGTVDEVRYYDRVLGLDEVVENYQDYEPEGIMYSKNLLKDLNSTEIIAFNYNCSISGNEELKGQFSQDNKTWYNSDGLEKYEIFNNGKNTINLKGLKWEGNFYYYVHLIRSSSPKLYKIELIYEDYEPRMIWSELLFGSGFWLGLIIIECLLFIITSLINKFGYMAGLMSILMFMVYYQNIPTNTFEYWGIIFMGLSSLIFFIIALKGD